MLALRQGKLQLDHALIARLEKLYNGEVAYVDSEVGRLLDGLAERGLDASTVVVVTADHGEEFNDHGGFEHGHTHYNELLHVPLLIRAPGLNLPEPRLSTTVRHIDLAPTLCELAGVPADPAFTGESLVPLLQGQSRADRSVLSEGNMWGPTRVAWRNGGMKLVRSLDTDQIQLFDLGADPGEQNDIAQHAPQQRDRMLHGLDIVLLALATKATTGEVPSLTPEQTEFLSSLGYIGLMDDEPYNDNSANGASSDN
jgi:arylsulfatase A-like enzyme